MAIFQISRIQLRRGKKNQGSGLPQLASGEMAWAIDTQELFIGNGAISEGAPAVGNTKILTEKDSLLSIAAQYQYKFDHELNYSPITGVKERPLQHRLDDGPVNARNFGIVPYDELTVDQSANIQQAINSMAALGIELQFDPGEYVIARAIILPSNAHISGLNVTDTVFKFTGTGPAFDTEENSENQRLHDFSIKIENNESSCIRVRNATKQQYYNLSLSSYDETNASLLTNDRAGILLVSSNAVSNNKFVNIEFRSLTYGVVSKSQASFNLFDSCFFNFLYQGLIFGVPVTARSNYNVISNCVFDTIQSHAIIVNEGIGNTSSTNTFKAVATGLAGMSSSASVIKFIAAGNSSVNDTFERHLYLDTNNPLYANTPYVSDLEGTGLISVSNPRRTVLPTNIDLKSPTFAFKLPLNASTGIKIDYVFRSTAHSQTKRGTITLAVDRETNSVQLADDYEYVGDAAGEDALQFSAKLETKTVGTVTATDVRLYYNNLNENDANTFTYVYSILS